MKMSHPVYATHFWDVLAEVVDVNVLSLLALDVMTNLKNVLDFGEDVITSKCYGWSYLMVKKLGHAYIQWVPSLLYTELDLRLIHRHFYHPQTDKPFAVMRIFDSEAVSIAVYEDLEKIQSTCDVCQRESDAPPLFRVSLPYTDCVFNRIGSLDLIKLEKTSVLHVTKFSAANCLNGESSSEVLEAFLRIWVARCVGYPDVMAIYQRTQF